MGNHSAGVAIIFYILPTMKLPLQICLTNIGVALFFSVLFSLSAGVSHNNFINDTFVWLGVVSPVGGIVDLLLGVIFLGLERMVWV